MVIFAQLELRFLIGLSMCFQTVLFFWTYYRKKSSSQPLVRIFGLVCYLAADFVAARSLGNIFQNNVNPRPSQSTANKHLLAFWAQLILVHLGGHSKLAAFTMEDNEVWLRDVLRFLFHEATALFVCIRMIRAASTDRLRLSFLLILSFLIGSIKFGERVFALKQGSMKGLQICALKKSDLPVEIMDESKRVEAMRHGKLEREPAPAALQAGLPVSGLIQELDSGSRAHRVNPRIKPLCEAYESFKKNKGLYIDNICASRDIIEDNQVGNSVKFMEMELSFAYDLFYTKSVVLHTKCGWFRKAASLILIVCAVALFPHNQFEKSDVRITHSLLILALVLELLSSLETFLSNHTMVQVGLKAGPGWRWLESTILMLHDNIDRVRNRIYSPRLSKIGQYCLLDFCFRDCKSWRRLKRFLDFVEVKEFTDSYLYIRYVTIDDALKTFIFQRVKTRLNEEEEEQRRNQNIEIYLAPIRPSTLRKMGERILQLNTTNKGFEKCLLTWHLATDLCHSNNNASENIQKAKLLSEYMLYLLAEHPSMLSTVVTLELKSYQDARGEASQLFTSPNILCKSEGYDQILKEYRAYGSVLSDGAVLAWELMSHSNPEVGHWSSLPEAWIEMLSYAAIHSRGKYHAQRLGTGGELFTLVWLYMVHLGMHYKYRFQIESATSSVTNDSTRRNQQLTNNTTVEEEGRTSVEAAS